MNRRSAGAALLIGGGLLWFGWNAGWLPEGSDWAIAQIFERYWPALLVLAGVRLLIQRARPAWAFWLGWLIVLLAGLGLYCWLTASPQWVIS
ncbi:hypothetical protein EDC14_102916 [Hydrogenispora ethanolica]|uniref:DUF5668 domain-containing protein n=1 Tax=Hydrogenispora ethanolica TaxID=1082276 RepID=A0A4V2QD08_HYDET|nr:hypothetical protein [Hydrogenispora ethanolica]TCL61987.1 hypothetical protein EDC14_102916 [Hydrogenispora ethanolica]